MPEYQDVDLGEGVPEDSYDPSAIRQGRGGGSSYGDADYIDPDVYTQPDTAGPIWGDPYSLYGWITGFDPINQWDQYAGGIGQDFGDTGNWQDSDAYNSGLWSQYGGYTGRASDGFDDPYNMGWNLREMQTAEGADRFGSEMGQYDPSAIDMLNRMSGNAYRGASWDPWNMGWSQREADTARMNDVAGWDDPRYRSQREGITEDINQPWDEERRIYDEYGNMAQTGGDPYRSQRERLAGLNATGIGRFDPERRAMTDEFATGRGMYDDQEMGLIDRISGDAYRGQSWDPWEQGWNRREADTARELDRFGFDPSALYGERKGLADQMGTQNAGEAAAEAAWQQYGTQPGRYQGTREDVLTRFAQGRGGYDDPTQQAIKQSAAIPIQSQLGGIEQAVNRNVARTGNAAGAAGALVQGRLDAANQVARNMNQAQVQIADAARQDQMTGLSGLGQMQGELDARTRAGIEGQREVQRAGRQGQLNQAGQLGQLEGESDARRQYALNSRQGMEAATRGREADAATRLANASQSADARRAQALGQWGQMTGETDARWNQGFNQYGQMGQQQLGNQQYALGQQNQMLQNMRGARQQAFQNYTQMQGEADASQWQALQNRMSMENAARAREAQALQGYMGMQGQADSRYQTQLGTQMTMNEQARARQQAAMQANERAIDRRNTNQLAGAQMAAGLGNKQTQGQLANIQNFFQLLGQQSGGANQLGTLISAITSLPIYTSGVGEQSSSGSGSGFSI